MRKVRAVSIAVLWLMLAVAVVPAQTPAAADSEPPSSWWSGWFAGKPKKPPKKPEPVPQTPIVSQRNAELKRLLNAYERRIAVCDRLREISYETNDSRLEEEANQLEKLATRLHKEQSDRLLGVVGAETVSEPATRVPVPRRSAPLGPVPPRLLQGGRLDAGMDAPDSTREIAR